MKKNEDKSGIVIKILITFLFFRSIVFAQIPVDSLLGFVAADGDGLMTTTGGLCGDKASVTLWVRM